MPVGLKAPSLAEVAAVRGVRWGVTQAGIRKAGRLDLAVLSVDPGTQVAGVFTQNRFCAAPVQVCRAHLAAASGIRALVINTGNANAGTGEQGLADARATCDALAAQLKVPATSVLPFSTGVIMEPLPMDRLLAGLAPACADLRDTPQAWLDAAQAIMTTDTLPKACTTSVQVGEHAVTVTGISKGAGMIKPNMATLLAFVATDAAVAPGLMPTLVQTVADASFNCITVDGDTSTNDSFLFLATGQAGHPPITDLHSPAGQALVAALTAVAQKLAQAIIRDGEGATKFITVNVFGGRTTAECRQVAYAVAQSPLVKTALYASDPNLGRILAAVGYAGLDDLDPRGIDLWLGPVHVVHQGGRRPAYREEDGQAAMEPAELTLRIGLGRGEAQARVWTCDFSEDYVRINADYRS